MLLPCFKTYSGVEIKSTPSGPLSPHQLLFTSTKLRDEINSTRVTEPTVEGPFLNMPMPTYTPTELHLRALEILRSAGASPPHTYTPNPGPTAKDLCRLYASYDRRLILYPADNFDKTLFYVTVMFTFSGRGLNHDDDERVFVPSLAHALASRSASYCEAIAMVIASEPSILDEKPVFQFKKLIMQPLRHTYDNPSYPALEHIWVGLEGINRLRDEGLRYDILQTIGNHIRGTAPFRVHWVLCSSLNLPHIRSLSDPDWPCFQGSMLERNLGMGKNMLHSTQEVLEDGFLDISHLYAHEVGIRERWPPSQLMAEISRMVSGTFHLARFLIDFVADKQAHDPRGRLDTCLELMRGFPTPTRTDPPQIADQFYRHILSTMPLQNLTIAMNIIGLDIVSGLLPRLNLISTFLGIDYGILLPSIRPLSFMVKKILHSEFLYLESDVIREFLLDPRRSGDRYLNIGKLYYTLASRALHWLVRLSSVDSAQTDYSAPLWKDQPFPLPPGFIYPPSDPTLSTFSLRLAWVAFPRVPENLTPRLITKIKAMDAAIFEYPKAYQPRDTFPDPLSVEDYSRFFRWLYHHDPLNPYFSPTQSLSERNPAAGQIIGYPHHYRPRSPGTNQFTPVYNTAGRSSSGPASRGSSPAPSSMDGVETSAVPISARKRYATPPSSPPSKKPRNLTECI